MKKQLWKNRNKGDYQFRSLTISADLRICRILKDPIVYRARSDQRRVNADTGKCRCAQANNTLYDYEATCDDFSLGNF